MDIAAIAFIVFFLAIGINAFYPHRALVIAYGIAAILIGIIGLIGGTALTL